MKHALDLAVGARGWGYGLEMFPSGLWRNGVRGSTGAAREAVPRP